MSTALMEPPASPAAPPADTTGQAVVKIPDVLFLGNTSKKNRRYPPAAQDDVIRLASKGVRVMLDHSEPGTRRSVRDLLGYAEDLRREPNGVKGTLCVFTANPMSSMVIHAAKHAPKTLGMSIDSRGSSHNEKGVIVVDSVDQLLSIDVVLRPATTEGLFEDTHDDIDEDNGEESPFAFLRQQREPPEVVAQRVKATISRFTESYSPETNPGELTERIARFTAPDRHGVHRLDPVEIESAPLSEDIVGHDGDYAPPAYIPPETASLTARIRRFLR